MCSIKVAWSNGFVRLDIMVGRGERPAAEDERNLTQHNKETLSCGVKFEACWHEVIDAFRPSQYFLFGNFRVRCASFPFLMCWSIKYVSLI